MKFEKLARESLFSLLSGILPSLFGIVAIPILIHNIGINHFGIFTLALGILGYVSILDLGMGRLLSKSCAELNAKDTSKIIISDLFSFSLIIVFIFSFFISIIAALWFWFYGFELIYKSLYLAHEVRYSLLWVIISTPLIALTGTLRGGLEGLDQFRIANKIQILGGTGNLLLPALLSFFNLKTSTLFFVVFIFRTFLLIYCMFEVFKIINFRFSLSFKSNHKHLKDSFWISLSSFLSPLLLYTDRFVMGSLYTLREITFYGTPMDLVLRALVFPQGLSRVFLPNFSSTHFSESSSNTLAWSYKIMIGICFPVFWILSGFNYYILKIWLGVEIANQSSVYLSIFSFGLFWNSLNWVTLNLIHAKGYFKETFFLQLLNTVFYILFIYFFSHKGLIIISWLWSLRLLIEVFLFFIYSISKFHEHKVIFIKNIFFLIVVTIVWLPHFALNVESQIRIIYSILILILGFLLLWYKWFSKEERNKLLRRIRFYITGNEQ